MVELSMYPTRREIRTKDDTVRTQPGLLLAMIMTLGSIPGKTTLADEPVAADLVLKNGTVIDGTGSPRRKADVAIRGDRIVAVGNLPDVQGARVIDASAWVVAGVHRPAFALR